MENDYHGTIAAGTGWGKTKCAVVDCYEMVRDKYMEANGYDPSDDPLPIRTLIVVIREEHRDVTWPHELKQFGSAILYDNDYKIICWASLTKEDLSEYDLIILDEVHHITEDTYNHLQAFNGAILGLSATPPHEEDKREFIQDLCPVCYVYGLESGVAESINAPYTLHVIKIAMDDVSKTIKAGTKAKPFMTTEAKQMKYLDAAVQRAMMGKKGGIDFAKDWAAAGAIRRRKDAIYNSKTKRDASVHLMRKVYKKGTRLLVFGGSIEQIDDMTGGKFTYHSKNKKLDRLGEFCNGQSDILITVGMVDEGSNLPSPDVGVIMQTTASERRMVQRIGRMVRFRPNYHGHLYLMCLMGTQDEMWVNSALSRLPSYRYKIFAYNSLEEFKNTEEWIIRT